MHMSDSDDDPDYVPTELDSASSGDEGVDAVIGEPQRTEEDEAAQKTAREKLWAEFQASVNAPPTSDVIPKMVKIEKRYRFAGEDVIDVVEVPEDSQDARKWPRWHPPENGGSSTTSGPSESATAATLESADVLPQSTPVSNPPTKRPGPRKPKISLAALPTPASQKAKKISTLDKSVMDWRVHLDSQENSSMKDELEANRRGGGFLEKVEFLKRVEERKDDVFESNKAQKRRRL